MSQATPENAEKSPKILRCEVTAVYPTNFTVDLFSDDTKRYFYGIPFAATYMHPQHGAGVFTMPEVGAMCFLFILPGSEDTKSFVLGFQIGETPHKDSVDDMSDTGSSYHGLREPMEPGDIFMGTADDNRVVIRKGGIIQIGSTGLSQRIYIPVENMIRDYFQRYQAISPVGEIEWGHATLVSDVNPTKGIGDLDNSNYFIDDDKSNKLDLIKSTPVLVKYNIKDLCQEDVSKGKYTVELRMGRLTTDTLDPEEDIEHVFAHKTYKRSGNKIIPDSPVNGSGIRREEKGVVSCTIYSHDKGANKDKVTYAFQINRDGDSFIFSRGHVHVEIAETVYANVQKGAKIEYGDAGIEGSQAVIELLQSNELKTKLKNLIHEVLEDMEVDAQNIKLNATDEVHLGEGADDYVVRKNDLQTFMQTQFKCVTAFGPSGPMIPVFDDSVGSTKVKVKP